MYLTAVVTDSARGPRQQTLAKHLSWAQRDAEETPVPRGKPPSSG